MRSVQLESRTGIEHYFWNSVTTDELTVLENMPLGDQIHTSNGGLLRGYQYVRLGEKPAVQNGGEDITFIVDRSFIERVRSNGCAELEIDGYSFKMQRI